MKENRTGQSSQSSDVISAWKEGVAEAGRVVKGRERELLPRFAEQYEKLRALPRRVRKGLQKKWKHTLAGVAMMLALGVGSSTASVVSPVPCPGGVGDVAALIQAINDANTMAGADTITLESGCTFTLTSVDNSTYGATGLPVITSEITIAGNGSTITRMTGSPNFRIIAVNSSGNLTLQSTTISGGSIDGTINALDDGGGISNYYGTVTLTDSTVTGNTSTQSAGGVYNTVGTMTLTNSTVSGNSALGGGGVYNTGTMTLTNSTVSGNSATTGGGVVNVGTMTLTNSTVSGNSSVNNVGGVLNEGTMTLTNSTVSGNSANNFGGVVNVVTMTLSRTLISGNTGGTSPEVANFAGTLNANDFNLFGSNGSSGTSGFTPGATDVVPGAGVMVSDILAPLALNAPGNTQTHALVEGSPAVDASPVDAGCQLTDQRGVERPQGAACDIGSFELEADDAPTCNGLAPTNGCTVNGVTNQPCVGTEGNDVIRGTGGADVIVGLGGNDRISGAVGSDTICGDGGNDRLAGGGGGDLLIGGEGTDRADGQGGGTDTCQAETTLNCETILP